MAARGITAKASAGVILSVAEIPPWVPFVRKALRTARVFPL
jgi:hypothetical protein